MSINLQWFKLKHPLPCVKPTHHAQGCREPSQGGSMMVLHFYTGSKLSSVKLYESIYIYMYSIDTSVHWGFSSPKLEEIAGRSRSSINTCVIEVIASPFKKLMSLGLLEKTFYLRRCSCWVLNIKSSPSVAVGAGERFST